MAGIFAYADKGSVSGRASREAIIINLLTNPQHMLYLARQNYGLKIPEWLNDEFTKVELRANYE